MRSFYRAGAVLALAYFGIAVGPASAATADPKTVAQAPAAQSTLSGKITDARGNPLAGATISAEGNGRSYRATTLGDGSFQLSLPPGLYSVTINHGGFQPVQNDVAVPAGGNLTITVPLSEQNLQSLQVIGHTSTTFNRTPFNVSESAVSTLPSVDIAIRQQPNVTDVVTEIPGVVAQRSFSATPNTDFVVRGGALQTRVTIDGHPISSGTVGQWNTNYANSLIFQDVEVVKGAGLNGSIAGESAVGTVNLRTRNFTANNTAGLTMGFDSYNGGLYNVFADVNFLPNNRASLIVQKSFTGFNGPWGGTTQFRSGATAASSAGVATGQPTSFVGLTQWTGDFSNNYSTEAELVKLRYRFSETSSVTLEYLGLQGQYQPQGGSYASYIGNMTQQACENGSAFQPTLATCLPNSTYTAPYTFKNIGSTVNAYTWFPNSYIQNNEPMVAAEFRTAIGNDTLLLRPYTHVINRFISGTWENHYPGNAGGWFAVTSVANCQAVEVAPTAAGGAKGPCFSVNMAPNSPAYIGNPAGQPGVQYKTTNVAPTCSPTPPYTCFTTGTGFQNDGTVGFSTPFSQPELDRLNGFTFSYIHPVGDNIFNFSYDYRKEFAQFSTGDTSAAAPGCTYVIGSVSNTATTFPATNAQPGCSLVALAGRLPRSSIGTPPTVSQYGDFALTGTFQINPKLRLSIGNYFEIYKLNAQIEDPAVIAMYFDNPAIHNAGAAPVALIPAGGTTTHYDPHFGIEFRANRDLSLRASAGSSITQPYPGVVSGFGSVTIPNAAQPNYIDAFPNPGLKPETTVVYDAGFDQRLRDGGVLSLDAYDLTVHDVFLTNYSNIATIPGTCGPGENPAFPTAQCLQSFSINGPIQRGYGLELSLTKIPVSGFGYYVSSTLQRTYLDQLPLSVYTSNLTPTTGNFNISGEQLYGNPYFKAYGQLLWADTHGTLFELGADFEGSNNYTFGPPYTIWDAGARIPIVRRVRLNVSVQNLFNLNTGTLLGRSLAAQGNVEPTVYLANPATGLLKPGNGFTYSGNGEVNINALPPRNVRLTLDFAL